MIMRTVPRTSYSLRGALKLSWALPAGTTPDSHSEEPGKILSELWWTCAGGPRGGQSSWWNALRAFSITKTYFPRKRRGQHDLPSGNSIPCTAIPPLTFMSHLRAGRGGNHSQHRWLALRIHNGNATLQDVCGRQGKKVTSLEKHMWKSHLRDRDLLKDCNFIIRLWNVLPLYTLSPQEQGSSIITVDYSSRSFKIHILSEKKYLGKPQIKGRDKNRTLEELEPLAPRVTASVKHSPAARHINTNPQLKFLAPKTTAKTQTVQAWLFRFRPERC